MSRRLRADNKAALFHNYFFLFCPLVITRLNEKNLDRVSDLCAILDTKWGSMLLEERVMAIVAQLGLSMDEWTCLWDVIKCRTCSDLFHDFVDACFTREDEQLIDDFCDQLGDDGTDLKSALTKMMAAIPDNAWDAVSTPPPSPVGDESAGSGR
jgi:hypothetical protein